MPENPVDKPVDTSLKNDDPHDPALSPTVRYDQPNEYDEAAVKRARELLNNMPESVGPYRILERIGGGGMGEVYRAEQRSPIRRQVALKFIKLGMDSKAVLARFEAERQALALMDHPHIAKVFDAGTDDTGRPYFVMEYVKGKPITDYADQNHLTIRERLELFEQVCQAIQHAHHKGVIHRDLKPGNVLVSTQDERPFAKVIDFGIAKAISQKLTEATLFTQHDQFIGTPQYMSPEQAEGSIDIDTRTDVYSLGVILYELLTGSTPFTTQDLRVITFEQIKKMVIEVDPPKPSTRLTVNQPTLSSLATSRRTEPKRLGMLVQGELDWIVMKSLEKDRKRRYETPNSLANDIQAHLQGEPVQAAPPSTAYRIQKFIKKHRGPVIAVSIVGAVLLLGIIGTTWGYYRAERIAERERQAKHDANTQRDAATQAREQAVVARDEAKANAERADEQTRHGRRLLYAAKMNLTQAAWESNRVGRLLELLKETKPQPGQDDLRGFEWHYWNRLANTHLWSFSSGWCVAFSPDGKRLVTGGGIQQPLKVLDVTNGQVLLTLKEPTGGVVCVAVSPDGKWLAAGGGPRLAGEVKVWDAASGQETLTLKDSDTVTSVAFSSDGSRLASTTGGHAHMVKLWDTSSGKETLTLRGHTDRVSGVAFSPDGQRLASASGDRTVNVWNVATGEVLLALKGHHFGVNCVTYSPDGRRLATGSGDKMVKVWDSTSGQELLTLKGHADYIWNVAFSANGKRIVTACKDGTLKVWDTTTGQEMLMSKRDSNGFGHVALSPDGRRLASSNWGMVTLWDATTNQEPLTLKGHTGSVLNVAFSPDGKRLASAGGYKDSTVKVWDATNGQEMLTLKGHHSEVGCVAFSPDGKRLASAGGFGKADSNLIVWDSTSGEKIQTLKLNTAPVSTVSFSPDGKRLVSAEGEDGVVKVWDIASGQEIFAISGVFCVAFNADGTRLVSPSSDGPMKVWDAANGRELLTLAGSEERINCVTFSPDGKQWVSKSGIDNDFAFGVWDTKTGQETLTLIGHTGHFRSAAFSPDGKRLVSASEDGTVKVWDTKSGQETITLSGHDGMVFNAVFSPDGQRLASANGDGTIKVWDARPWTPELRAEREALSLIHFLRDQGKAQAEWLDAIAADQTISEPVRQRALQFTREWK